VIVLFVALSCAFGGITRYLATSFISRVYGERFPWGTLVVNTLGSFLLGLILAWSSTQGVDSSNGSSAYALLGVGFCGGLTTFSTFSMETYSFVARSSWARALLNVLGSVCICALCVVSGFALGELWAQ